MANIGENICRRRKELKMTQEELAAKLGYKSKSSINKIEMGINDLPQKKIAQFAAALDTTPSVLMGWVSENVDKNNDAIVDVVSKLRSDPASLRVVNTLLKNQELFSTVSMLVDLPPEQCASLKNIISALGRK